ncbi:MAG: ribonuclease J [Eubacteriales bacterium]|nr:ribonuclease J [Eubacteriales bacterium]
MSQKSIRIIPLGGVEEIGKNLTVFEYEDDIIIVDCGTMFPSEDMPGVDLVLPDAAYLYKNADRIRGLFITHGHEDHIGAIPYILRNFVCPVYATELTKALIEFKLKEHMMDDKVKVTCVEPGDRVKAGCFTVEYIHTNHSFAGAAALAIHTPVGVIVHTGDFKIDFTPVDGGPCDLNRFAELGSKGVLALMSDSTNVLRPGYTMSEVTVGKSMEQYFNDAQGRKRIIIATFSSNIHRIQQIIDCAGRHDRKVCICGRSMTNICSIAVKIGKLNLPESMTVDVSNLKSVPPEKLVVITTGSQGEPMSGLSRMANDTHDRLKVGPNDMVIISATPIPGNEKMVSRTINSLCKKGCVVVYEDVHVSGHACKEELKLILSLTKPKYFIPVHGEYRHLMEHAMLAESLKIPHENVFIPAIGTVIELNKSKGKMKETVPSGEILVDGSGIGDVGNVVLRDRRLLAMDGLVIVIITMAAEEGVMLADPDVVSRGFVYMKESEVMISEVKRMVAEYVEGADLSDRDWNALKAGIKSMVHEYLWQQTKRSPMILPVIVEV